MAGQLGWVVWSATDPFRVRRGFFGGDPGRESLFSPFLWSGDAIYFWERSFDPKHKASPRASRAGQPSCQPSWPAKLACQAGLPSWVRWLGRGSQAGELLVLPSRRGSEHGRATQPAGHYSLTDRSPLCGANLPTLYSLTKKWEKSYISPQKGAAHTGVRARHPHRGHPLPFPISFARADTQR